MKGDLVCKLNKELALMREQVERLKIERDEAKVAADFANLACDKKDAEISLLKSTLDAHNKALVEAREALEYSKTHNHRDNFKGRISCKGHECPVCDSLTKSLATINSLLGQGVEK